MFVAEGDLIAFLIDVAEGECVGSQFVGLCDCLLEVMDGGLASGFDQVVLLAQGYLEYHLF